MKFFKNILNQFKFARKKKIVHLFALLGYKLNSYHFLKVSFKNILTSKVENVGVYNQFVPSYMRHPVENLKVGYWVKTKTEIKECQGVDHIDLFGFCEQSDRFEFYFPLDLDIEYPGLLKSLGRPNEVLDGILNPSGRSIWMTPSNRNPVCLKIDTLQLDNRRYFSERALLPNGIIHSVATTKFLQNEKCNCSEDRGCNIYFNYKYSDGTAKRYTYLLREFDFKKLAIRRHDFLLPLVAVLSTEFWGNQQILKILKIKKSASDFLLTDFAKCFADLIRNSLQKTYLHFEVHQQNLSLHLQNGRAEKIVYHDLQDTVFDTVTYLLDVCQNTGLDKIAEYYDFLKIFQKNFVLNGHGHLLTHNRETREYFSVVSIYRRYLRNFGAYNKSLNYYLNSENNHGQYFTQRLFEAQVLKYLRFTEAELECESADFRNQDEKEFLTKDIFWCIDRFHQVKQERLLQQFVSNSKTQVLKEISSSEFEQLLYKSTTLCSNGFPIRFGHIEFSAVTKVVEVYEDRVLLVTYKNQDFLIIRFY